MCGILLLVRGTGLLTEDGIAAYECASTSTAVDYQEGLRHRGPDHQGKHEVTIGAASLCFHGSLLQLRGTGPSTTPLLHTDPTGDTVLLFNGEVFGGLEVPPRANDGKALLEALSRPDVDVPTVLSRLRGPWALALWHGPTQTLWYGRDVLGRRSLLVHLPRLADGRLILASSAPLSPQAPFQGFEELPPGLFSISFKQPPPQQQQLGELGGGQNIGLVGTLRTHSWADPWVAWLGHFSRAQAQPLQLIGGQQKQPLNDVPVLGTLGDSCRCQARYGAEACCSYHRSLLSSCAEAAAAVAGAVAGAPPGNVRSAQPASSAGLALGKNSAPAAADTTNAALNKAVDRVLAALRSSLAVRCSCIEHHQPYPSVCGSLRPPEAGTSSHKQHQGLQQQQEQKQQQQQQRGQQEEQVEPAQAREQQQRQQTAQQQLQQVGPAQALEQERETALSASSTSCPSSPVQVSCTPEPSPSINGLTLPLPPELTAAVAVLTAHVPPAPILILFSGGLDSTLLAALAHEALPPGAPIDLASVCFAGGTSPDRLAALDAVQELRAFAPSRQWRLMQVDATLEDVDALRPHLLRLLAPCDTVMDLNIGAALWLATRAEGRLLVVEGSSAKEAAERQDQGGRAEQQHQAPRQCKQVAPQEQQRYRELEQQQQQQQQSCRQQQHQQHRQHPLTGQVYRSAARVVLLGHGADELCGGYGRHRTRFRESGWAGLEEELSLDMRRLWKRNLGRDDRLVADHGREARHPFLDEGVVAAVLGTPLELVADLRLPAGVGDKLVLRQCLRRLGLFRAASRVKRAIQFGSSLGKQSNRRDFGSNRAANARSAGSVRLAELAAEGT